MNFKIDFDEAPTLIGLLLLAGELIIFGLILVALIHFVYWEALSAIYFRALGLNIFIVLVCAYFNKEMK